MNTSPPLSIVIVEILRHTPHWVWLILAAITLLGALQLRQYRISRGRLLLAPIALGAYSLWGASSAFGAAAVPAWLAGMALTLLASRALRGPRTIEVAADGRFVLPGSPWPLLLMWSHLRVALRGGGDAGVPPSLGSWRRHGGRCGHVVRRAVRPVRRAGLACAAIGTLARLGSSGVSRRR